MGIEIISITLYVWCNALFFILIGSSPYTNGLWRPEPPGFGSSSTSSLCKYSSVIDQQSLGSTSSGTSIPNSGYPNHHHHHHGLQHRTAAAAAMTNGECLHFRGKNHFASGLWTSQTLKSFLSLSLLETPFSSKLLQLGDAGHVSSRRRRCCSRCSRRRRRPPWHATFFIHHIIQSFLNKE